jgi:hypothetical protein
MNLVQTLPADVARKLGHYVYAYVSPLDSQIFYVGKGKGRRVLSHLGDRAETRKLATIKQIRAAGKQPELEILAHGLRSADIALQVEAAVIDALGLPFLTNAVRGWCWPFGTRSLAATLHQSRRDRLFQTRKSESNLLCQDSVTTSVSAEGELEHIGA